LAQTFTPPTADLRQLQLPVVSAPQLVELGQTRQVPSVQTALAQSSRDAQPRLSAQRGQVPPPQSIPVSPPFLMPSMQVEGHGSMQRPPQAQWAPVS
jgi:hypothetical protein